MASGFHLLASEAVIAPFYEIVLGIRPREAGEHHT